MVHVCANMVRVTVFHVTVGHHIVHTPLCALLHIGKHSLKAAVGQNEPAAAGPPQAGTQRLPADSNLRTPQPVTAGTWHPTQQVHTNAGMSHWSQQQYPGCCTLLPAMSHKIARTLSSIHARTGRSRGGRLVRRHTHAARAHHRKLRPGQEELAKLCYSQSGERRDIPLLLFRLRRRSCRRRCYCCCCLHRRG